MLNYKRYKRVPVIENKGREWPDHEIEKAPVWCSVDLRDGNQALIEPMVVSEKIEYFKMLVKLGFKEIEVGFPSASGIEYDFLRQLVERDLIPDDVAVQVLVQCREHLIRRTFESIQGTKKAIVHIYNSTSTLQRDVVFGKSMEEIKQIALDGVRYTKKYSKDYDGELILEYSPESFTGTELPYALEICEAVLDEWGADSEHKVIINLPATVEMTMPNVYADQIEWMINNFKDRDRVIVSIHPHNDRGTAVAAAECAMLAGCDRVEGTLFGNGERTGNADILNIAYNMFSQGIDPELNIENVNEIIKIYESSNKMEVGLRHPYAGKLVFTAFSGSHQDAINKGVKALKKSGREDWEVPYLPIDPSDVGREYEPIVRINSQSGKGGVAFVMDTYFGYKLPKSMHKEFADVIQELSEKQGEISPDLILEKFNQSYINQKEPYHYRKASIEDVSDTKEEFDTKVTLTYSVNGNDKTAEVYGNGPIDAVNRALQEETGLLLKILDYSEHALQSGANAQAAAYIQLMNQKTREVTHGVGISSNITRASIRAVFSAINRLVSASK